MQEQVVEDKSISKEESFEAVSALADDEPETLLEQLENGDTTGLDAIYKQIVTEISNNKRKKRTHWGPLKNKSKK